MPVRSAPGFSARLPAPEVFVVLTPIAGWLAGLFLLARCSRWPAAPVSPAVRLSIIIPARNEAARLPRLLDSIRRNVYRPLEVLVVDDHSTDATAAEAGRLGARVVAARALPEGWTGKAWACMEGARAAGGTHLLFLDADTWFDDGGLERLAAAGVLQTGALSVQPYHVTRSVAEQGSAFFNLIQLMATGAFAARRPSGATGLFGACLWIDRATYEAVGGHAAVKGRILENVMLSAELRKRGFAARAMQGRGVISFRMYDGGWGDVTRGWRKAFASGAAATPPGILALIILWIAGVSWVPAALMVSVAGAGTATSGVIAGIYAAFALQLAWQLRQAGRFQVWTWLLFPIPMIFFLAVFASSAIQAWRKRPALWRGRQIPA